MMLIISFKLNSSILFVYVYDFMVKKSNNGNGSSFSFQFNSLHEAFLYNCYICVANENNRQSLTSS